MPTLRRTPLAIASIVAVMVLAIPARAGIEKTQKVVRRYTRAIGGERLADVETVRVTGFLTMMGFEAPFTITMKRPDRSRMDVDMLGRTIVQAFDGENAWWINPLAGVHEPAEMPEDFASQLKRWTALESPLLDYRRKNNRVDVVGPAEDGTLQVRVRRPGGEIIDMFLDTDTWLEVRRSYEQPRRGKMRHVDTYFDDYTETDGVMTPGTIRGVDIRGSKYVMSINNWQFDAPIDDDAFAMPSTGAQGSRASEDNNGGTVEAAPSLIRVSALSDLTGAFNLEEEAVRLVVIISPT